MEKDVDRIINLATNLLKNHLEKYLIADYDRRTQKDMTGIWEASLNYSSVLSVEKFHVIERLARSIF